MTPRICVCCGEPMSARGNALSRNPNICASCSSLADGIEEPNPAERSALVDLVGQAPAGLELAGRPKDLPVVRRSTERFSIAPGPTA